MPPVRAQYHREWHQANLHENRRKRRESTRLYRARRSAEEIEADNAKCRIAAHKRYAQDREQILAYNHKWAQENSGIIQAKNARHRAAKLKAMPAWLTPEQHQLIRSFYELARATGLTVDHIVPLQGKTVCGLHVPWNLQLLPRRENCSKRNSLCL